MDLPLDRFSQIAEIDPKPQSKAWPGSTVLSTAFVCRQKAVVKATTDSESLQNLKSTPIPVSPWRSVHNDILMSLSVTLDALLSSVPQIEKAQKANLLYAPSAHKSMLPLAEKH